MEIVNAWVYKIDAEYLHSRGDKLCTTINGWLAQNGCDVMAYTFTIEDEDNNGDLIVDYSFDLDSKDKCKSLVEQILKRFEIIYKI